jgi:hypothetical protein
MQRVFRGYKDRQYINELRAEKARFESVLKCVVAIQSAFRRCLAKERTKRMRAERRSRSMALLQKQGRSFLARRQLTDLNIAAEPLQVRFVCSTDPKTKHIVPCYWQLWAGPSLGTTAAESGGSSSSSDQWVNLFQDTVHAIVEETAATKLEAGARGMMGRKKVRERREIGPDILDMVLENVFQEVEARKTRCPAQRQASKDSKEAKKIKLI